MKYLLYFFLGLSRINLMTSVVNKTLKKRKQKMRGEFLSYLNIISNC